MQNTAELNAKGKFLGEISSDFVKVAELLKEASYQMRVRKISDFPVFPISKEDISLGQKIIEKESKALKRDVYISYYEHFIQLQIVSEDNIDAFASSYKNPDEYCCLFVAEKHFMNFIYIPYPVDDDE